MSRGSAPARLVGASLCMAGAWLALFPSFGADAQAPALAAANTALQAGEADRALALLAAQPGSGADVAEASNLECRVRLTLEQWDAAIAACQKAVKLNDGDSNFHLWLGRAYGQKASRASFMSAFTLAKQLRAEFEQAVKLDPRNVDALADLGDFDRQAPAMVGGGIDKARAIVVELEKVDARRAHNLRGSIAEQQKDYAGAENEYKQAVAAAGAHAAGAWSDLAGFYARRQRYAEMDQAIHNVETAAAHDKRVGTALYDCAGLLMEAHRDPALAATLLAAYLDSAAKSEDAPAFQAHLRLAKLKQQLGDPAAAERERKLALELAQEYKPAQDAKPSQGASAGAGTNNLNANPGAQQARF